MRKSIRNPQAFALGRRVLQEPQHALGRMRLSWRQDRVQKAVSQPIPVAHAVVVARDRIARDQPMRHGVFVVAVIRRARLVATHRDRKTVDINRDFPRGRIASRGPEVPFAGIGQRVAQGIPVARLA